jgi:branched-chain amino acid transport system substrate-binding protein
LPKGLKKFGSLACAEAPTCSSADKLWHDKGRAKQVGFEPVYRSQISIAQPDFTAECLRAKGASAQVVAVLADVATVRRVAASCVRQGYRPMFFYPYSAHLPADKDDPNLDGSLMAAGWFPAEVKGDTPARAEYVDAFRKFLGGERAAGHSGGWAAAKIFERAAMLARTRGPRREFSRGLWTAFKGETLGGLTMPLTSERERPAAKVNCWTNIVIEKGKYVMPTNGAIKCA